MTFDAKPNIATVQDVAVSMKPAKATAERTCLKIIVRNLAVSMANFAAWPLVIAVLVRVVTVWALFHGGVL